MKNLDLIRCKNCEFFRAELTTNLFGTPVRIASNICERHNEKIPTDSEGFCYLARPRREPEDLTEIKK